MILYPPLFFYFNEGYKATKPKRDVGIFFIAIDFYFLVFNQNLGIYYSFRSIISNILEWFVYTIAVHDVYCVLRGMITRNVGLEKRLIKKSFQRFPPLQKKITFIHATNYFLNFIS